MAQTTALYMRGLEKGQLLSVYKAWRGTAFRKSATKREKNFFNSIRVEIRRRRLKIPDELKIKIPRIPKGKKEARFGITFESTFFVVAASKEEALQKWVQEDFGKAENCKIGEVHIM